MKDDAHKKCLIADYDPFWRDILKRTIKGISGVTFKIKTSSTYEDALEKIKIEKFDIMLLDLRLSRKPMPKFGRKLLSTLKTSETFIPPTIVVSGSGEFEDVLDLMNNFRDNIIYFLPKDKFSNFHNTSQFVDAVKNAVMPNAMAAPLKFIDSDPVTMVINLCKRFPYFVRGLTNSPDKKKSFSIKDEYDVQFLFQSLLRLHFDDIRAEEYTPSYAGSASRIDFLLVKEKIAIEIKMTRKGLIAKKIGEELSIDIAKYRSHPSCKTLICFVYDPVSIITNPVGLINDLNNLSDSSLNVKVVIP